MICTTKTPLINKTLRVLTFCLNISSSLANAGWFGKSCDPHQITVQHAVGLSSLFESRKWVEAGNEGFKVDIPVSINGQRGCFSQAHDYRFGYEKNKNGFKGSITVKAPEFEFENINDARIETYVQVEGLDEAIQSQIRLTSFVCSGESVLSVHTYSNQIKNIAHWVTKKMSVGTVSVIATGAAARALEQSSGVINTHGRQIDDFFAKEYLSRSHYNGRLESLRSKSVSIPSVYIQSQIKTPVVDQNSFYTTEYVKRLGCTKEFTNIMRPFHLSQLEAQVRNGRIGKLSVDVDEDGFEVSWR